MQDLACETSMAVERSPREWILAKHRYKKLHHSLQNLHLALPYTSIRRKDAAQITVLVERTSTEHEDSSNRSFS